MMTKFLKSVLSLTIALLIVDPSHACSDILISKGASKDGSVMITYAADSHVLYGELYYKPAGVFPKGSMLDIYDWDSQKFLGKIPQVTRTYQTVGNMNEHQLMITESTWGGLSDLRDPKGGIDYGSLIYVTLQRAKTAREAIETIVDLANEHGYYSSGESFSIADKDEVWLFEMIGKGSKIVDGENVNKGIVWVAARVPDGYITAHANQARIDKIDFNDKENWLYADDVVSFAREMGYFEGKDEEFSFSDTYCPADFGALRYCEARVWSLYNILGKGMIGDKKAEEYLDYAMGTNPKNKLPLFIKPAEKVDLKEVADAMRDHYEDSPMNMRTDIGAGGHGTPYRWRPMSFEVDGQKYLNERAVATQQTGFWILCQARDWLPDTIGGVLWFGVDDAATSALTPIYTNVSEVPECIEAGNGSLLEYSPTSLFWVTNRIANFAYMLYDRVEPEVKIAIDEHELSSLEDIKAADKKALELLGDGKGNKKEKAAAKAATIKYLTDYSVNNAQELFKTWQELDIYLLLKYMDGNVKKQNEDGTFKNNGNSPRVPASPDTPGYSQKWKEAVVKDNGDILKVPK